MGQRIIKNFTKRYVDSFGNNLTDKQIEMVKDTLRYKRCELADAVEELKQELKITLKKYIKGVKWVCIKK